MATLKIAERQGDFSRGRLRTAAIEIGDCIGRIALDDLAEQDDRLQRLPSVHTSLGLLKERLALLLCRAEGFDRHAAFRAAYLVLRLGPVHRAQQAECKRCRARQTYGRTESHLPSSIFVVADLLLVLIAMALTVAHLLVLHHHFVVSLWSALHERLVLLGAEFGQLPQESHDIP